MPDEGEIDNIVGPQQFNQFTALAIRRPRGNRSRLLHMALYLYS
jgi:hypothetical protein